MIKAFFFLVCSFLATVACAQKFDVQHYEYQIELSEAHDTIYGKATVRFQALSEIASVNLDLKSIEKGKGMKVLRVESNAKAGVANKFEHKNDQLIIHFDKKLRSGEEQSVVIYYSGIPANGLIISKNHYGAKTFFADNWPDRAHHWIPCVDHPSDKATVDFIVIAPPGFEVISNGLLQGGKAMNLHKDGKLTWHYSEKVPLPTKVMVVGAADFAIHQYDVSSASVPVSAYIFPRDSATGVYNYRQAPSILQWFTNYIGSYPYQKLANVQSKTMFGGMENASAIFYYEESAIDTTDVEDLLAHEIAHQWFGNMVTEKSFSHLWLSEGFATFFTNLYLESARGREYVMDRRYEQKKKIIAFAKQHPYGVVDSSSALMALLNANSYEKGGFVLHMLKREVGSEVFKNIINAYYEKYKGRNADTRDFEKVAEEVSQRELTWFFDQWLYRPGLPRVKMSSRQVGENMEITIEQVGENIYRFPLRIEIAHEAEFSELEWRDIEMKERSATILVKMKKSRAMITLDPESDVLIDWD